MKANVHNAPKNWALSTAAEPGNIRTSLAEIYHVGSPYASVETAECEWAVGVEKKFILPYRR